MDVNWCATSPGQRDSRPDQSWTLHQEFREIIVTQVQQLQHVIIVAGVVLPAGRPIVQQIKSPASHTLAMLSSRKGSPIH